jgi:hypothetical protein
MHSLSGAYYPRVLRRPARLRQWHYGIEGTKASRSIASKRSGHRFQTYRRCAPAVFMGLPWGAGNLPPTFMTPEAKLFRPLAASKIAPLCIIIIILYYLPNAAAAQGEERRCVLIIVLHCQTRGAEGFSPGLS